MDGRTFDVLVKGTGRDCTRRRALAGLAAALIGLPAARKAAAQVETAGCAKKGDDCLNNYGCCEGLKCRIDRPDLDPPIGTCVNKNNSDKKCREDRDCKNGERCKNGKCKNKNSDGGNGDKGDRCNNDNDCKSGLRCKDGKCKDENNCGREDDRCRTNGDCCNALICDRDEGRCRK
jgi:hypothetical protein